MRYIRTNVHFGNRFVEKKIVCRKVQRKRDYRADTAQGTYEYYHEDEGHKSKMPRMQSETLVEDFINTFGNHCSDSLGCEPTAPSSSSFTDTEGYLKSFLDDEDLTSYEESVAEEVSFFLYLF